MTGLTLGVRVTPRARADTVTGWSEHGLEVRLRATPEDGAANASLVALLADVLGVPRGDVAIRTGTAARLKRVSIAGDGAALESRLATLYGPRNDG